MTVLPRRDQLHTADQAAAVLGVPAATIRKWARAGKVMSTGMVPAPVPGGLQSLYRLEELQPLAERYHQRLAGRASLS